MRVAVVGAGLGGLAAACYLAGRGHDVVVLERDAVPGGRAGLVEDGGYRFDTGPVVLTMVDIIDATFAAAGADRSDHVRLLPLDPMYRACFADGSTIRVRRGGEAMAAEIRATCGPSQAAAFERFSRWLTELYEVEVPNFIDRNYRSPLDLAASPVALWRLVRLGGLRRMAPVVASFFSDERLQRLFSFQALYAGLSPFTALAAFSVITYMDTVAGVWFPEGGMHALARGLAAAAEKAGASFRYGEEAERVVRSMGGHRVKGVRLTTGEVVAADAVVLNPDLPVAYRDLLPELRAPRLARRGRYSPSCLLWLAGGPGDVEGDVCHHNIHFGAAWDTAFTALLDDGTRMPDPSLLVTVPTVTDPSLAPPGRTSLYVLEPVPNLDGAVQWETERDAARRSLAAKVASLGYSVDVEAERWLDPLDWNGLGMERGTPFSLAHQFFQSGPFRPANVDRRLPGVAFVGSGTQPGVGVPMVLLSGRLAADRVEAMA